MANNCEFDIKIAGKRENINELLMLLDYKGTGEIKGFGRVFDFSICFDEGEEDGLRYATICGDCAWSIYSALLDIGKPNLLTESKRLQLVLEAYSREPGICFAEHYIISKGEILLEEEVDYQEIWVPELTEEELQELSKKEGKSIETIRSEAYENGDYYSSGGFGEDYANFENLAKYFDEAK